VSEDRVVTEDTYVGIETEEPSIAISDLVMPEQKPVVKEACVLVETLVLELSRQELYEKIWEISVAGVAKELDIPYSQLMKQVKAANIPIPPSGYWTKLSFGKPVEKNPLNEPTDTIVSLHKTIETIIPREIITSPTIPKANKVAQKIMTKKPELPLYAPDESEVTPVSEETSESVETYEQYGQTYNVYNREKLYQEVWEKPVTEVAKRYKVSDVAIHKVCKSLDIPTPEPGYWAKVRAGKPVKQIPLPNSDKPDTKSGIRTGLETHPQVAKELLQFLSPEDKSIVLSVAMQIQMPDENARMHSKIIAHRKKVVEWHKESRKRDQYWNRRNKEAIPYLADAISEAALPRVCRIFDALIKTLEPLGCSLTDDLSFLVNGETISLSVSESQDKIDHIPTKEENMQLLEYEEKKRRSSWASKPNIRKYDHVYNGKLSLIVESEKSFRDCKSYVIEDRLGDILVLLYEASNGIRLRREAREAEERRRQEEREAEERRKKEEARRREERREKHNLEVQRTNALVNAAADFDTAQKIRSYISAIEQTEPMTQDEIEWISWAKKKAAWYDPTDKYEDEVFGKRKPGQELKEEAPKKPWEW